MAINIFEQPIKPVVNLEDAITVYVPGYSRFGPEEPTLCTTVSQFEGLYGSSPYLFENDQLDSGISKGSPEKGYLYAKNLLSSGLQIIFHRFKPSSAKTAEVEFNLSYGESSVGENTYPVVCKAVSFGRDYKGTKVSLTRRRDHLFNLAILNKKGEKVYSDLISLDPSNPLYIKNTAFPLVEFKTKYTYEGNTEYRELEDTQLEIISSAKYINFLPKVSEEGSILDEYSILTFEEEEENFPEFFVDDYKPPIDEDTGLHSTKTYEGMLSSLSKSGSSGMAYCLSDFEKFPSISYITTGGYWVNSSVAGNLVNLAEKIKAIYLVDLKHGYNIKDVNSWTTFQSSLSQIPGTNIGKGKTAAFIGCNSFDLSPYRVVLGDSFNYLKCLGENMSKGIPPWIPVANDPNGISSLGYDSTDKISTELSEMIAESVLGVQANPLIYSYSAGGYKIMGNRTILSNDGVLSPNSFLNVSVVVNRIERACRQVGNKLKIVSTNPAETFQKFKNGILPTIEPMVTSQDGLISYKIRHLKKTKPSTIDIQIQLVVVEGIETFNIYIPYSISIN